MIRRIAGWLGRGDRDLQEEIREHIEMENSREHGVIVLTLTFGISLCSSVFTLNAEVMRAKVDHDPASFFRVVPAYTMGDSHRSEPGIVPLSDYRAYRASAADVADLAAWDRIPTTFDDEDSAPFNSLLVNLQFLCGVWTGPAQAGPSVPSRRMLERGKRCKAAGNGGPALARAGWFRLVRQLLSESLILACLAASAHGCPGDFPRRYETS